MHNFIYETKYLALKEIFELEGIFANWTSTKLSASDYLDIISRNNYSLADSIPLSAQGISNLNKRLMPGKQSNTKPCTYLLHKYGLKYCPKCTHVYELEDFYSNDTKTTGKDSYCKKCFCSLVVPLRRSTEASKRADKKACTPSWANLAKIKHIYANCKTGNHIDHIIPLRGDLVCGLHVENNLQEISATDNILKSNKFDPMTFVGP